jgi:hypothetical protein
VGTDQEVTVLVEAHLTQDVGGLDLGAVVVQHLAHRGSGQHDPARLDPLGEQVAPRMFGVNEVEVGDVVNEPAIGLLGHILRGYNRTAVSSGE